jgi:hypothetical protein
MRLYRPRRIASVIGRVAHPSARTRPLYTTITQADVVEKVIRLCPHHRFGPVKIGTSIGRSPALSPAAVSHPPRPGQAADRRWKPD